MEEIKLTHYQKHKDTINNWRIQNREKYLEKQKEYYINKISDEDYRLKNLERVKLAYRLKRQKQLIENEQQGIKIKIGRPKKYNL